MNSCKSTEIEKTEGEIKVLQAKLELLKEMEKHKTPVEEEPKGPQTLYDALQLRYFTVGYHFNEGQKDWICKVVEEWLSQFYLNKMSFENLSYRNAFFDALDLVRKTLR
jgi:peptidase E